MMQTEPLQAPEKKADALPARRPDLIVRPAVQPGQYVVKNPAKGTYLQFGEEEHFLLLLLDGCHSGPDLQKAFEERFGEPLSDEDLEQFLKLTKQRELLQVESKSKPAVGTEQRFASDEDDDDEPEPSPTPKKRSFNILYFRYSVFDPDRLFNWLEPKLRFVWTRGFFWSSLGCMVLALLLVWSNRHDLVSSFAASARWETVVLVWLAMVVATTIHEFGHGLTCKHYGGEVHQIGVLVTFFMPCFFCNVSDAWLIPDKKKRLWITAAGSYCDLCIWALAVFVWRLTVQDSLINYLSFAVLSVCGARVFFNFHPLLRLDGYYFVSDLLEIPNLRRRGRDYWMGLVRWFLWGAPRPQAEPCGRWLVLYGGLSWLFGVALLEVMLLGFFKWLGARWGVLGALGATYLLVMVWRRVFSGFCAGELKKMIKFRKVRTSVWVAGLVAVAVVAMVVRTENRTAGAFQVRPAGRVEIRAAVAGFLRDMNFDEGDRVPAKAVLGRLEVPDLESQLAQKTAGIQESQANLRRLEAGPRPEEISEQRARVARTRDWCDEAQKHLERARVVLHEDLARLDQQIEQCRAELKYASESFKQATRLYELGGMAGQQYMSEQKRLTVARLQCEQAEAQKRSREAEGTLQAEGELSRRAKELADAESALTMLEAGSRPEEIDAEKARLARLQEELKYLESVRSMLDIHCPLTGLVTTPRMKEKLGQYFEKGALICVVEDATGLEAEIAVPEQDLTGVKAGQAVELKARALPFRTFRAQVDRIAPRVASNEKEKAVQANVTVYCHLEEADANLLAGMTGVGRIFREKESLAGIMGERALRYIRTEFWW